MSSVTFKVRDDGRITSVSAKFSNWERFPSDESVPFNSPCKMVILLMMPGVLHSITMIEGIAQHCLLHQIEGRCKKRSPRQDRS